MPDNMATKLIRDHLVDGDMTPGEEIAIQIDQTLTQDATGTMVMLELEAMGLDRVQTRLSVQYVDHNLIQADHRNPDDHLFLYSACRRFGLWYSRPGNGVSHPVHQERFGLPGATLLGSDSHTCAAGAIGMLAIGAGGLEVALAMAGEPFHLVMPETWGVELTGRLPDWVSAKDVILEMLRRHDVKGGVGRILEYYGPGVATLSAMDRHVIANMGAELGATATLFPSDDVTRRFMRAQQREDEWRALGPDDRAPYDIHESIDLSRLEPLIAMPSSPGNVRPVRDVQGEAIHQAYIGSSANPGYRDIAVVAEMCEARRAKDHVSLDINPASRQVLETLTRDSRLSKLIHAGARLHQVGCNGCIGMGQAPATDRISLRTVPRNFPGRSGTREDKVCLVSPETAAASALRGVITDPRDLDMDYPRLDEPDDPVINDDTLTPPLSPDKAREIELIKGPNVAEFPRFNAIPDEIECEVLLKLQDNISTDEILPAGARVLPFRSNIPEISKFTFDMVDDSYHDRAMEHRDDTGHIIVAGENYGQGSSREHAAIAPRYLGLRCVLARSFARIHWQNLVNFGVLPVTFGSGEDYDAIEQGQSLRTNRIHDQLQAGRELTLEIKETGQTIEAAHQLSDRQVQVLLRGGLINWMRERLEGAQPQGAARSA